MTITVAFLLSCLWTWIIYRWLAPILGIGEMETMSSRSEATSEKYRKMLLNEEDAVLHRLNEIRNSPDEYAKYNTPEWVMRETLASMALSDDSGTTDGSDTDKV